MARTVELFAAGDNEALAAAFERGYSSGSDLITLGLEEELILVDPVTYEPANEIESLLASTTDPRIIAEFRAAQVELVMPVSVTVAALRSELAGARASLIEALDGRVRAIGTGTHPTYTRPPEITDRPRYKRIALEHPWVIRRAIPSGLHVHVGLGDADEALAVYNAVRSYLPDLAALTANSPYFEGEDTRLASTRIKLVEDHPRHGIPPAFASWRELAGFVTWGAAGGLFDNVTFLWWDLRLRPDLGTMEFRIADSQTSVDGSAAYAAICQCLVASLRLRHRAGERLPAHPSFLISENRWRALADGLEAVLVDPDTGAAEPARSRLARLLLELEPYAAELGCSAELDLAWPMLVRNGAIRQREIVAERGIDGLLPWLADETEETSARPPSGGGVLQTL
jgi:carboxylate-amine ligase